MLESKTTISTTQSFRLKSLVKQVLRYARHSVKALLGKQNVLVVGDSHAKVFRHWWFDIIFPTKIFQVVSVSGATVSGLKNPNSKTQAFKTISQALAAQNYTKLIVILGEVDTGFVIWYRAQKYNEEVSAMLSQAVERYKNFLAQARAYGEVIVISTPLPTIEDNNTWGEVANLRKDISATQREKTELTLVFNQSIQQYCQAENITYISLDQACLDKNGLVKKELKNPRATDHHYHQLRYAKLISYNLKACL